MGLHLRSQSKPQPLKPSTAAGLDTIMGGSKPMPRREAVDSSHIQSIGFRENQLFVKFKGTSSIYVYSNFPEDVFAHFRKADSMGEFFNQHIRGKFKFTVRNK
jgi:hypothetical protein